MITDPATLAYCPCGKLCGDYPTCPRCYRRAPLYWRLLFTRKDSSPEDKARARGHILEHARKRGLSK